MPVGCGAVPSARWAWGGDQGWSRDFGLARLPEKTKTPKLRGPLPPARSASGPEKKGRLVVQSRGDHASHVVGLLHTIPKRQIV